MRKQTKQTIASLLVSMLLTLSFVPISAEDINQYENTLEGLSRRMWEQMGKLTQIKKQVNSVSAQLNEIETELELNRNELKSLETQLITTQTQIDETKQLLEQSARNLENHSKILNKRVRAIYISGQINYLDVLLDAVNFSDFVNRLELWKRVIRADVNLIAKFKIEQETVTKKKNELERDVITIQNLHAQAEEKRAVISSHYQAKLNILNNLKSERTSSQQAYDELQQASSRVEAIIRSNKGVSPQLQSTGRYIWPASGPVTSNFGWRTHPIFGNKRLHAGIDIGADYGDTAVAADGGVVITAGWISGYGKTVIIEHNSTYSTLYGHNSELLVKEGQVVQKGQPIARIGDTGYTTGPVLHFEIRVNGQPDNPLDYLS